MHALLILLIVTVATVYGYPTWAGHVENSQLYLGLAFGQAEGYGDSQQDKLYAQLHAAANHSWEWGTESQVIMELFYPEYSVFSTQTPGPIPVPSGSNPERLADLIDPIIGGNTSSVTLVDGDGASGDPMSLLTAVVVLDKSGYGDRTLNYALRAEKQLNHLLLDVPRGEGGIISHRESEVQLWSDFVFQAPPAIAFYGAQSSSYSLLLEAYNQCRLYRDQMIDTSSGLWVWHHILLGSWQDTGLWSTGNGWAAMGMMHVLQTFAQLPDPTLLSQTAGWQANLSTWITEIVDGAWTFQGSESGLLPNYLNRTDPRAFDECSGTAIIAATTFRLASAVGDGLTYPSSKSLDAAEAAYQAITTRYVNEAGVVGPVVNPLNWNQGTPFDGVSPEGQGFALMLITAREAYIQCGGRSAALSRALRTNSHRRSRRHVLAR